MTNVTATANLKPEERTAPNQQFKGVRMSVKSNRRIDFVCDLGALVDMTIPVDAWYGKQAIQSANICEISAQRLRVEGMEDVYVDLRVYTKSNSYEARKIKAEQALVQAEKAAKLEAVRPQVEAIAAALNITFEEALAKFTS